MKGDHLRDFLYAALGKVDSFCIGFPFPIQEILAQKQQVHSILFLMDYSWYCNKLRNDSNGVVPYVIPLPFLPKKSVSHLLGSLYPK